MLAEAVIRTAHAPRPCAVIAARPPAAVATTKLPTGPIAAHGHALRLRVRSRHARRARERHRDVADAPATADAAVPRPSSPTTRRRSTASPPTRSLDGTDDHGLRRRLTSGQDAHARGRLTDRARDARRRARSATRSRPTAIGNDVLLPGQLGRRLRSVRAVRQPPRPVRDAITSTSRIPPALTARCPGTITESARPRRPATSRSTAARPTRRSASPRIAGVDARPTRARGAGVHVTLYDRAVDRRSPPRSIRRITPASSTWMQAHVRAVSRTAPSCACSPRRRTGTASSTRATSSSTTASRRRRRRYTKPVAARARPRDRAPCGPAIRRRSRTPTTSCGRSRWPSTSRTSTRT